MSTDVASVPDDRSGPILHVVVVGFHHKKGCQVEYSYPPLIEGESVGSHECPEEWKHLPSLALPDGSHNYEQDTIFFHMPARNDEHRTVFCVSCYRQMNAENLVNRSADVTRGSVQKSVCVISTLPLYGLIQAKLELITHAYFDERDFSKVALLEDTYRCLNTSLTDDLVFSQKGFLGMSVRDLVILFKHKVLLLFKLILLERKVLFFKSPVKNLCSTILSLLSLFPGMIEYGLYETANASLLPNSPLTSPNLANNEGNFIKIPETSEDTAESARYSPGCEMKSNLDKVTPEHRIHHLSSSNKSEDPSNSDGITAEDPIPRVSQNNKRNIEESSNIQHSSKWESSNILKSKKEMIVADESRLISDFEELLDGESRDKAELIRSKLEFCDKDPEATEDEGMERTSLHGSKSSLASMASTESASRVASLKGRVMGAISYWTGRSMSNSSSRIDQFPQYNSMTVSSTREKLTPEIEEAEIIVDGSGDALLEENEDVETEPEKIPTNPSVIINLTLEECGLPLSIFTKGVLCHPYLSLPYLDLLTDVHVRSFVIGATNVLFKQKQQLCDIIIEIDEGKIDIHDLELRKQLHLTTEDLRFADYIVRHVTEDKEDIFLDGTGWEGGDEWIRAQFKYYLVCLMRSSQSEDIKDLESFNTCFIDAWKGTQNYKVWASQEYSSFADITAGHPFQGQLSMADMKLRFSHTMQNTERGRKLNQAMATTGRAVAQTSKAVGGAISQAKSAVSSWLLTFATSPPNQALQSTQ